MLIAGLVLLQSSLRPLQVAPSDIASVANQPQLAASRDGTIWIAYGANHRIYVASSKDNGRTFSEPVVVNEPAGKMAMGMRRGPRIAANKNRVVVSAVFGEKGGGADGDLLAWRSRDGEEWDGPEEINDVPGSAREGFHAMGAGMDDAFVAIWLDLRTNKTRVMGSFSSNGGRGWADNKLVYESPEGSVCECCHPSLGFGPFGEVVAMFRNSLRGNRDMYAAVSPDGGRSWDVSHKVGSQTWTIGTCPMDGGAISFDGSGGPVSVWRSEDRLYLSRGQASTEFAIGTNPWLAMVRNNPVVVWQSGESVYMQVGTSASTRRRLSDSGRDPVVVATKSGALAAWRQTGPNPGIFVQRIEPEEAVAEPALRPATSFR